MNSGPVSSNAYISCIPLLTLPLAFVGLLDDRLDLPATLRLFAQFATSVIVAVVSPLFNLSLSTLPLFIFMVLLATAVINFTNFMDGLDGLVASCLSVVIGVSALYLYAPWPIWSLFGALLGFLFCNWYPAKVFMGDSGSTFLGAVFIALVSFCFVAKRLPAAAVA